MILALVFTYGTVLEQHIISDLLHHVLAEPTLLGDELGLESALFIDALGVDVLLP